MTHQQSLLLEDICMWWESVALVYSLTMGKFIYLLIFNSIIIIIVNVLVVLVVLLLFSQSEEQKM